MPLSRDDRLNIMAKQIRELQFGEYEKRILIVCDNNTISEARIFKAFEGLLVSVVFTGEAETYSYDQIHRKRRITYCWNTISRWLKGENPNDLVLAIEDDGNFQSDAFLKLEKTFRDKYINTYCKCGFVSAVEAGRWSLKMIGAWRWANTEKTIVRTVPFQSEGIVQVHATGFYFFVTTVGVLTSQQYRFDFFGPDWCFGMDLSEKGYFNFIDYSVKIGHDNGVRPLLVDEDCIVLEYVKHSDKLWRLTYNGQ